jgi:hypothetical protein
MSYTVQMLLDNVVFQTVKGEYSLVEMTQAVQEMASLVDKANQACYLIVDLSKMKAIESNLLRVRNAIHPLLSHPQLKVLVAYGSSDNAIVNFMSSIFANLFKLPLKIVGTQEEAVAFLINQEPSLNGKIQAALQKLNQQAV